MKYTIAKIRCGSYFDGAALQKALDDQRTIYPMLRRALNQRIRHGKSRLRIRLRRKHWSRVLKHPALVELVGNMIRERAAQSALFPSLFGVSEVTP